jgi:hypothetical protein
LAGDAGRVPALFREARLIDHEDGPRVAQFGDHPAAQVVADRVDVPGIAGQDPLDAAGMSVTGLFGQLPAVLPLDVRHQPAEVVCGMAPGLGTPDVRLEQAGRGLHGGGPLRRDLHLGETRAGCRHGAHLRTSTSRICAQGEL